MKLADLGLSPGHTFAATDVLKVTKNDPDAPVAIDGGTIQIENQPPQSVRMIKIIDRGIAEAAPSITAQVPGAANAGQTINFSTQAAADGVPAVTYRWDFGDGTSVDGAKATHTYTRAGDFSVRLSVDGLDGLPAQQTFSVKVTGNLESTPNLTGNRRFVEPTDR